ncbi:MAG: ribosomal protein S19 family protein [Candidatus Nanoarchaeia archaeon]|nr:ribosomal protein S19 family protein [Candidatus Nanoarchaeia archaeon]MDD5357524.1 ribosomal protein S19 family protein [Candidatus Nanoarchaeia archaeon]MDD5588443.1 ribosomal protein S19 family protein [Candidatus Nanoarchaeia archaeon]
MAEKIETTKKQITFRGKTIDELKALETREFAKFLKSRTRRAVLRQFQDIENFVSRAKIKTERNKPVRTHKRTIIIVPQMVGMKLQIYNGKEFIPVDITTQMLGHRLGEFSMTRAKIKHSGAGIGATKGSKAKAKK